MILGVVGVVRLRDFQPENLREPQKMFTIDYGVGALHFIGSADDPLLQARISVFYGTPHKSVFQDRELSKSKYLSNAS